MKLPAVTVARLLETDVNAIPFQPMRKPKMKEWLLINLDRSEEYHRYLQVFEESFRHVLEHAA